jgi:CheY-like chemotaxis protein
MVRAVAERALTRHGYTVHTAENGEAALELLDRLDHVDLMISDVVMPTMDGPTTVREARKTRPDLPILFISGYAESSCANRSISSGSPSSPSPFPCRSWPKRPATRSPPNRAFAFARLAVIAAPCRAHPFSSSKTSLSSP